MSKSEYKPAWAVRDIPVCAGNNAARLEHE